MVSTTLEHYLPSIGHFPKECRQASFPNPDGFVSVGAKRERQ